MKKLTVILTALVVLSLLLPSCGNELSGGNEQPSSPDSNASELPSGNSSIPSGDSQPQPDNEQKPDENAAMKKLSYYQEALFDRYIAYKAKNPSLTDAQVVTHVNVGLDYPYYSSDIVSPADNVGTNLVLANKYKFLSSDYEPTDLVTVAKDTTTRSIRLCEEAARAFEKLSRGAKDAGYTILGMSGYRSFSYQKGLYDGYLKDDPQEVVDTYSARAGHSEHQTGLAMDVQDDTRPYNRFGETAAYRWAVDNIHIYGFVIHYTADNEFQTGYKNEPWHFRYVGVDVATHLYHHNKNNPDDILSIDEFIAREMSEPYLLQTNIA